MEPLSKQYKIVTSVIVGALSVIFVRAIVYALPWFFPDGNFANISTQNSILIVLGIGSFFTGGYAAALFFYEKWLWKYHIPRHNYSGYWAMKITYEAAERKINGKKALPLPYSFESVFKVEQHLDHVAFTEGFSAPKEVWRDTSLRLNENGFVMSYKVTRSDMGLGDALPRDTIGFEEVEVTQRNKLGWPETMLGSLRHVAISSSPLYRGSTVYRRIEKETYDKILSEMNSGNLPSNYEGK